MIIRIYHGKQLPKFKTPFEFENEIELMACATALQIFYELDFDQSGAISVEEFLIWHNMQTMSQLEIDEYKAEMEQLLIEQREKRIAKVNKLKT